MKLHVFVYVCCIWFQGKYTLPSMSQDIGAEVFPSGDYQVTGSVTDKSGKVVACLEVQLSVA